MMEACDIADLAPVVNLQQVSLAHLLITQLLCLLSMATFIAVYRLSFLLTTTLLEAPLHSVYAFETRLLRTRNEASSLARWHTGTVYRRCCHSCYSLSVTH